MRNILWYYYQIRCDEIGEKNGDYEIICANGIYCFKELKIPIDVLKQVLEVLYYNQVLSDLVVINKDGNIDVEYNKKRYVLLKRVELLTTNYVDLTSIVVKRDKNNIGDIWANKIDYYMVQLKELGMNKEILTNSFNYYVGMAENAISMANRINENNIEFIYAIQHSRMKSSFTSKEYYDPTLMVVDLRIRDLSEYIKHKFIVSSISVDECERAIEKYDFTEYELNMLYARLFYPTYYFDLFEDMIIDEEDEKKIINVLRKRDKYETFLSELYKRLRIKTNIFEIEWIKKEL